jgi:hypothetical protein
LTPDRRPLDAARVDRFAPAQADARADVTAAVRDLL